MEEQKEVFEYNYSAAQQKEIENIKKKYMPKEVDKMEELRRLDRSADLPGTIASILVGIVGTLLFGIGMCCTMLWADKLFVLGIIIGVIGMGIIALAFPVYKYITKKNREKIAPQILELTEQLQK